MTLSAKVVNTGNRTGDELRIIHQNHKWYNSETKQMEDRPRHFGVKRGEVVHLPFGGESDPAILHVHAEPHEPVDDYVGEVQILVADAPRSRSALKQLADDFANAKMRLSLGNGTSADTKLITSVRRMLDEIEAIEN